MTPEELVRSVAEAPSWNARVGLIRRIPEAFGTAQHQAVYAQVADEVYVPLLKPDFGYVHWRPEYELGPIVSAYSLAEAATAGFTRVTAGELALVFEAHPQALRIFRLLLGFTSQEFASCLALVAGDMDTVIMSKGRLEAIEGGRIPTGAEAAACAAIIDLGMRGSLCPGDSDATLRPKQSKPDTARGWDSVRAYAQDGVPLAVLLHQRAYGGAFR